MMPVRGIMAEQGVAARHRGWGALRTYALQHRGKPFCLFTTYDNQVEPLECRSHVALARSADVRGGVVQPRAPG